MKPSYFINYLLLILVLVFYAACQDSFLDKKPSTSLIVPTTLDDFQRLMDDYTFMNVAPNLGEISSDNYFLPDMASFQSLRLQQRNAYLFQADIYEGDPDIGGNWNVPYQQVFVANIVLEGLENSQNSTFNILEHNRIKGWALFNRGHAFFNLAQIFAPVYDESTAKYDLGIPLRLKSGVDDKSIRANLQDTYNQIISDLSQAVELLPDELSLNNRNRPTKAAVLGLLARVYLNLRNYNLALRYATECLNLYSELIDYNDINNVTVPFEYNHKECLFQATMGVTQPIFSSNSSNKSFVDSSLYNSYNQSDLRKDIYFKPAPNNSRFAGIKSSLSGGSEPFGGIATDEVYLIKAECLARLSNTAEAVDVLNELLVKRYKNEDFSPIIYNESDNILALVLDERRKELPFRGLRWQDLRRLNKENYNISVKRFFNGQLYELLPNSPLFVLPIPPDEIRISGIQQNKR